MNVFGIDYDQVHCSVALREQGDGTAVLRVVSDGARTLIPLAVANRSNVGEAELQWGSHALRNRRDGPAPLRADLNDPGPWLSAPGAPLFMQQLSRHLYGYIGRVYPNRISGYATVVAAPAQDPDTISKVKRLLEDAGLGEAEVISPPQALLCDWLSRLARSTALPRVIVAMAIGDAAASAWAIRLKVRPDGSPEVVKASPATWSLPVGHEHLASRVLSMVWERAGIVPTEAPRAAELALSDAVILLARSLGQVSKQGVVEWRGPLASQMYTDLRLQRRQVESWPEAQRWTIELPRLAQDAVAGLGEECAPDLIVLGGIGACWPFAAGAIKHLGAIEAVPPVWESVARGSAWWPVFAAGWPTTESRQQTLQLAETKEISDVNDAPALRSKLPPPWKRD
jgi:hypothetical protein